MGKGGFPAALPHMPSAQGQALLSMPATPAAGRTHSSLFHSHPLGPHKVLVGDVSAPYRGGVSPIPLQPSPIPSLGDGRQLSKPNL